MLDTRETTPGRIGLWHDPARLQAFRTGSRATTRTIWAGPLSGSDARPIGDAEAARLFAELKTLPSVILAVSGGPDSTALLMLAARWRKRLRTGPELVAVTIDHGLRPEARREAMAVKRLAARLGIPHRTLRWREAKPSSGVQEKARAARYALLAAEARRRGAQHLVTAHTLDDQAETVLFRLARGSGLAGLAGMAKVTPLGEGFLIRPFLGVSKARLVATLAKHKVVFADDPSNRDPRYARARLRAMMPRLTEEGLHAARLAAFAARMRRANQAIEIVVDAVARHVVREGDRRLALDAALFAELPEEVALRLLGRMVAAVGDEGPVELGKLEAATAALRAALAAGARLRRTLAGAMMSVSREAVAVERAPPRRNPPRKQAKRPR